MTLTIWASTASSSGSTVRPRRGKLDITASEGEDGRLVQRTFVHNYSDGLTAGPHTIRAAWSDPTGVRLDCEWDVYFLDPATEDVGVSVDLTCEGTSTLLTVTNEGTEAVFVEIFGRDGETEKVAVYATLLATEDSAGALLEAGWEYEWQVEYLNGMYIYDNGEEQSKSAHRRTVNDQDHGDSKLYPLKIRHYLLLWRPYPPVTERHTAMSVVSHTRCSQVPLCKSS